MATSWYDVEEVLCGEHVVLWTVKEYFGQGMSNPVYGDFLSRESALKALHALWDSEPHKDPHRHK